MIETIATSSVLIIAIVLLRYVFKGKIKWCLQYALWLLVALRLLFPFSFMESSWSVLNVADINSQAERIDAPVYVFLTEHPDLVNFIADADTNIVANDPASSGYLVQNNETGTLTRYAAKTSWGDILRTFWLIGAITVGLWFAIQNWVLYRRLRKTGKPVVDIPTRRLPVYLTPCIVSPCLFGLFRPAVYLTPVSVADTPTVTYILAHEETHFHHGDHIWSYLRCLCLALYWFNPLVWWAAVLSRRDCELACDEGALHRLGDEHRKAYGNTLINMIVSRTKPADLLCGATTMTSGKSGIKERITMIAKKPKMLLSTLIGVVLLVALIAGCTFTGANKDEDVATPLTDEELAYFNGDEFFNGESYPNIRNQFLSSLYDSPEQIDLFQLFYCGSGLDESIADTEIADVIAYNGWNIPPDCACQKISRANMDAVLTGNMGLTLADTDGIGLEDFTYLAEYDAYYHYHGDTNYRGTITFSAGEREGDLIRLYYTDTYMADGDKVLTLREKNGKYLFVSNRTAEDAATIESVADPEGIIADDIDVPNAVLSAAKNYVQQDYQYWCNSTGYYRMVDGEEQMIGEPAVYDNWRIEGISLEYTYTDLNGQPLSNFQMAGDAAWQALDIYRLDYRIHTLTPDKVVLAGGMDLDEDGWLLPTYPESTYLYFAISNGEPQYLFMLMENDCFPGNEVFTNDIIYRLTASKEAHVEALTHLQSLFNDGESAIWYEAADKSRLPDSIPEERAKARGWEVQNTGRYEVLFDCIWEYQKKFTYPTGAYLCLGDSPDTCFQFFLNSDLVLWRDGDNVTAWRAGENIYSWPLTAGNGATLPGAMMLEFSGYEIDIANVTIPEKTGEAAADTVTRFLDAYGTQLKNVSPENIYYTTDFRVTDISKIETKNNRILAWFGMAVQPPEEIYESTYWWAGNSGNGEGELEGWIVMSREIIIEQTDGVWHCTDFGTGGASL